MTSRFRGSIHRSLDSKGRLMLPPEYRDIICTASSSGSFVLTGFDECIVARTIPEWETFAEKVNQLPSSNRALRDLKRQLLGRHEEIVLDAQGRVRISQSLMRYAGLSKEVLLVGQGGKFEIWDTQRFEGLKPDDAVLDLAMKELAQSGIDFSL
ncbi:MAG: division/cell wall cluster transcriptional repressor MraZ [Deltaproteobacteria bacterium]|jgi:MraZ protein|nr:division/cell wall cluster transcriptional repressor MraZ [Deltaproteobacteria bacterium]